MEKALIKIGDVVTIPKGYGYHYSTCDFCRVAEDTSFVVTDIVPTSYIGDIQGKIGERFVRVNSQYLK
jgi:hypothetical protein